MKENGTWDLPSGWRLLSACQAERRCRRCVINRLGGSQAPLPRTGGAPEHAAGILAAGRGRRQQGRDPHRTQRREGVRNPNPATCALVRDQDHGDAHVWKHVDPAYRRDAFSGCQRRDTLRPGLTVGRRPDPAPIRSCACRDRLALWTQDRLRVPAGAKKDQHRLDPVPCGDLQECVDATPQSGGVLLPQLILKEHTRGIHAELLGSAQLQVDVPESEGWACQISS
jgi:hypothetical protein